MMTEDGSKHVSIL